MPPDFPLLALESARHAKLGHDVTVIAIQEECASPEVETLAPRCRWISLGQLSKLIEILEAGTGITRNCDVRAGETCQDFFVDSA